MQKVELDKGMTVITGKGRWCEAQMEVWIPRRVNLAFGIP